MPSIASSPARSLDDAVRQFPAVRGYLAACTLGLPTSATIDALRTDLTSWSSGLSDATGYGRTVERVRTRYASLVHSPVETVAIGSQTSALVSVVAASAPDGAEVLCIDGDFSSLVAPFLVHADRGVTVRHVAIDDLAASIGPNTWLVAFSLVQSATGRIVDQDAVISAAHAAGALTLCDLTQATGWLPVDASRFDVTVCHAYKWLCAPRGVAFLTVARTLLETLRPVQAGWYSGEDVWASCYGPALHLSPDARRFDVSPAWQAWVGAEPVIDLFASLDAEAVHAHAVSLGDAMSEGLDIDPRGQAIITWPDRDGSELAKLTAAGITASGRAGRARVAFHLWNTQDDVRAALTALGR
jgi:selenocysteine lyase/cysteine desulfurase